MVHLKGRLDVIGFDRLLQSLVENRAEGTLSVTCGPMRKTLHVSRAGLQLLAGSRPQTDRLGQILLRSGVVSEGQIREIVSHQRQFGGLLGQIMLARGSVTAEELRAALREQVEEEICDVLTWEGASFDFTEGPRPGLPDAGSPSSVRVDVAALLLEAARRIDEMRLIRRTIPSDRLVPEWILRPDPTASYDLRPQDIESILMLVNGTRSVEEIVALAPFSRYRSMWTLYLLSQAGHLRFRPRESERERLTAESGERGMVLLLSNMPTFRGILADSLRRARFRVVDGSRAELSLAFCREHAADAVLLDLCPSVEEGLEVCGRLSSTTSSPIVVMTTCPNKSAIEAAIRAGAVDCLVKPFDVETAVTRLRALVGRPTRRPEAGVPT